MSRTVMLAAATLLIALPVRIDAQASWSDLVDLFSEWREFERPEFINGVPDYTPAAMAQQQRDLRSWKERLWALEAGSWPVEQQIDWHLVRAEMNGLDLEIQLNKKLTLGKLIR